MHDYLFIYESKNYQVGELVEMVPCANMLSVYAHGGSFVLTTDKHTFVRSPLPTQPRNHPVDRKIFRCNLSELTYTFLRCARKFACRLSAPVFPGVDGI